MLEPFVFYTTVLLTAFLGLILGIVAFSYRKLIKRYYLLKEEDDKARQNLIQRQDKLYKEAEVRANEIIADARAHAQKILSEAKVLTSDEKKIMLEELRRATSAQARDLENVLNESKAEIRNVFAEVSKNVQLETSKELESWKGVLTNQLEISRKKVDSELEALKQERLKGLEAEINALLLEVTKRVLGESISPQKHRDLVIKALEEAKRQKIF